MRWIGLGGTTLLAVAAWLAGALPADLPAGDPGAGLLGDGVTAVPATFLLGLACWVAGAALLATAWMRLAAAPAVPSRRLAHTAAWWVTPLLVAPALGSRDVYAYACQGWLWWHGADPYAVGAAAGGCPWAGSVPLLWQDAPAPYGPLALLISGLSAAPGSLLAAVLLLRLAALGGAILLAVAVARLSSSLGAGQRRAVLLGAVTPLVLVHGISGAHHDLLMTALIVAALAVAVRAGRSAARPWWAGPWLAGALLAAAVAIKITAIVVVPFLLILTVRRWLSAAAGGGLTYAALALGTGLGLGWINALHGTSELAQWSSPPTAVGMTAGYLLRLTGHPEGYPAAVLTARIAGLIVLGGLGIATLRIAWLRRHHAATVVSACAALLAATTLLGPVFYPWYALAPLAVIAALPEWPAGRTSRIMQLGTIAVTLLTLPNGLGVPVLTKAPGALLMTAAAIAAGWWAIRLLRRRGGLRKRAPAPGA